MMAFVVTPTDVVSPDPTLRLLVGNLGPACSMPHRPSRRRQPTARRAGPFAEWYVVLDAPSKDLIVLDTSGHRPLFEQPDEFVTFVVDTVLAETNPS
jgi:hypothetical protein